MSDYLHTQTLGDNFMPFGKIPLLIPAYQVVLETGIRAGIGGLALASPIICGNLKKASFIFTPLFN